MVRCTPSVHRESKLKRLSDYHEVIELCACLIAPWAYYQFTHTTSEIHSGSGHRSIQYEPSQLDVTETGTTLSRELSGGPDFKVVTGLCGPTSTLRDAG